MPKQVDHEQRRRIIADAAARIATTRGLGALTFREVAAEAGVSVSLIQHYFGTKDQLLVDTLDIQSAVLGRRILQALDEPAKPNSPLQRLRVVLAAFLPTDEQSREAMLLYLGFAGAALTDAALRRADAFRNAENLLDTLATLLQQAQETGALAGDVDPDTQAQTLLALILGLALAVLLEQRTADDASDALDAHLALLAAGR